MQYLVDTGIWLRLFDRRDPFQAKIRDALRHLRDNGHTLTVCWQNIAEFWNVSTRPASSRGGYGQEIERTEARVQFIERVASILPDSSDAYRRWRELVRTHRVQGVRVHDARLAATMLVAGVTQMVSLNAADFGRYAPIVAATPDDVLSSA